MNEFQQNFLRWLDRNRARLDVSILFERFEGNIMYFRFEGLTSMVGLLVSRQMLSVEAFKGQVDLHCPWDSLFKRISCQLESIHLADYYGEGVRCTVHEGREYVPDESREKVYADHCFAPLVDWIAGDLKNSHWLLFAEGERSTWAVLQSEHEALPVVDEDGEISYERFDLKGRRRQR